MSLDENAWTIARKRYLNGLDHEERLLFSEATIDNLYYSASVMNAADLKSSKVRKAIEAVQPLVDKIENFGKAMDAYANIAPSILSPIWGSIRVVLVLAKGLGRHFEKITECFGRIGDILPRLLVRSFPCFYELWLMSGLRTTKEYSPVPSMHVSQNVLQTPIWTSLASVWTSRR
jgi:hypothetical protein